MKKKLSIIAGMLSIMMFNSGNCLAANLSNSTATKVPGHQIMAKERLMITDGVITNIEFGTLTIKGNGNYPEIKLRVGLDTLLVDGTNGEKGEFARLQPGDKVTAYYSNRVTRSIPPQGYATALVVSDLFENVKSGFYMKVQKIEQTKNGIIVFDGDQDRMITISDKLLKKTGKIKQGDELMVWYRAMTMSIPAQANADRVTVLRKIDK